MYVWDWDLKSRFKIAIVESPFSDSEKQITEKKNVLFLVLTDIGKV